MRILHTSDIHMESALTSRLPADKVRIRREELLSNFRKMVEEAKLLSVRLFIIAGDLFDSEKISKKACERVSNIIELAPEMDFLYLPGNHEKSAFLANIPNMPKNLKFFSEDWTYFNYEDITVCGRSETDEFMFDSLKLDESRKNIVVLHGSVVDKSTRGGFIGLREAQGRGIDYMALGHYHTSSVRDIDERGVAVYSGTPEGRGFDEVGDKGFVVLDTSGRRIGYKFISFAKRRLHIVNVDITGSKRRLDIEEKISSKLSGIPPCDIVRVVLEGKRSSDLFCDTGAIVGRWGDAYFYFEVVDETKTFISPDDFKYDKSLKGEFIRLVCEKSDLSEDEKEKIIKCGLGALMNDIVDI